MLNYNTNAEDYYIWLCKFVCESPVQNLYSRLLRRLFERPFTWSMASDEDRATDGVMLRYLYGNKDIIDTPCSILEMMIGLANRKETSSMSNQLIGNRTGQWFWSMITSLGLGQMYDSFYDESFVDYILDRFLDRRYNENGEGGLFTISDPTVNMRNISIWGQSNLYFSEILEEEGVLERRYANG